MSNTLIVYYSHSGNTRKMAKIITEQLHADCLEIIPQKSYPQAYNAVVNQAKHEISQNYQPDIKDIQIDLNMSLIHILRCRRTLWCRSRWSQYH